MEVKSMWILFGVVAIIMAILNIIWYVNNREPKWFRFASLAFTALTLCAFYSQNAAWVLKEDWSALVDVVPTMSNALWILTIVSILINGFSFLKKENK
jgi:CDP-diglyceride synthetase